MAINIVSLVFISTLVGSTYSWKMMFVDTTPALAQIEAGALRPFAVTTEQRTDILPNVPTMAEAGLGGPRVEAWNGLFAPANTPRPVVEKLSATLREVMTNPSMRKRLATIGFEAEPTTHEQFRKRVVDEVALWASLTKQAGLEPRNSGRQDRPAASRMADRLGNLHG